MSLRPDVYFKIQNLFETTSELVVLMGLIEGMTTKRININTKRGFDRFVMFFSVISLTQVQKHSYSKIGRDQFLLCFT
jgi:hypothetical protein